LTSKNQFIFLSKSISKKQQHLCDMSIFLLIGQNEKVTGHVKYGRKDSVCFN
jgi:hypothetical protein